jgi:hypothetical protein
MGMETIGQVSYFPPGSTHRTVFTGPARYPLQPVQEASSFHPFTCQVEYLLTINIFFVHLSRLTDSNQSP